MKKLGHCDRLSELPESLIHHILSFLPLEDVVSTTILSKRWENLWTTVPCLNLIIKDEDEDEYSGSGTEDEEDEVVEDRRRKKTERLVKFVNWALLLWKGVKILKFKIDIKSDYDLPLDSDFNAWTRFAVNNGVEELDIITDGYHFAPRCLNSYSSLRKLSLVGCSVEMLKSPSWNQLKCLRVDVVFHGSPISGDLINQILLGSPQLEVFDLQLGENNEDLNIRSTSLKRLKVGNYTKYKRSEATLRICCPCLKTLEISSLFGKFLFSDVSSLINRTLHFHNFDWSGSNELRGERLKQVFSTIQHAEKVALSDLCVQVFGGSQKKCLHSPLPNVKFLKFALLHIGWVEMMDLFGIFPNLKMLVIENEDAVKLPNSNVWTTWSLSQISCWN